MRVRALRWALVLSGSALLVLAGFRLWGPGPEPPSRAGWSLQDLLGADPASAGFASVSVADPEPLSFPEDHGAHERYRNEWWYLTASLDEKGDTSASPPASEAFGLQFTLFRFALAPERQAVSSPWLSPQIYMAHLALTSVRTAEHRSWERISRAGPELAGADGQPMRLWLWNWSLSAQGDELFPARLEARAEAGGPEVALAIAPGKGRVLQGPGGVSIKNDEGGASYYYSYPRLEISGEIEWAGRRFQVSGPGWFDHEWSSNQLAPHQAGWDWFALQLDNNEELMLYRFRNRDGRPGHANLAHIDARGRRRSLPGDAYQLQPLDHWVSPGKRRYPIAWRLRVPSLGLDLSIQASVKDQEVRQSLSYWEGRVKVSGSHAGSGYVELTGYGSN